MKGTAGTLPCPAAERGHQVSAPHLCPARPEPTRLQCRERASVPWKVVLRPPAEGREAGEAGGREAARGVGWHIGVFGRTPVPQRGARGCASLAGERRAVPASRGPSGSAVVPAAVPRPAESFQRGEGQGGAAEDPRGTGAWRGRSSLSVLP